MKNLRLIIALVVSLGVVGCGNKPQSASSGEAIKNAESLSTVEAKANYLIKEAKGFVHTEKYKDAVKLGAHISKEYESSREEAQKIVTQAKAELEKMAKAKMEEMKSKLPLSK